MSVPGPHFTEEWLIRAIALISEVIVEHGAEYAPWLDRLEHELEQLKLKRTNDPLTRARLHLERARAAAALQAASQD